MKVNWSRESINAVTRNSMNHFWLRGLLHTMVMESVLTTIGKHTLLKLTLHKQYVYIFFNDLNRVVMQGGKSIFPVFPFQFNNRLTWLWQQLPQRNRTDLQNGQEQFGTVPLDKTLQFSKNLEIYVNRSHEIIPQHVNQVRVNRFCFFI